MRTRPRSSTPLVAALLCVVLAACATGTPQVEGPTNDASTELGGDEPPTDVGGEPTAGDVGVSAASQGSFLATVDALVTGTDYEGLAEADPQGFLEAAELVCAQLDAGDTGADVIARYLEELGRSRNQFTDDDALLAGALVGASVATFCPQHEADLPEV